MKTTEKTNGSQALDRALALGQPASDGDVSNSNSDELSSLPAEFGGMYRACYEAGYASGKEAGYRQGYQAGFEDGRGQGNGSPSTAAVENAARTSEVGKSDVENSAPGMRKPRLFHLPCTKCGKWFFSDEARCPHCQTPRAARAERLQPTQ
jgi:ribosomal protein L37E